MVAERAQAQRCPLCGATVTAGDGLEALGKHFQRCPKTEGARQKDVAKPVARRQRDDEE